MEFLSNISVNAMVFSASGPFQQDLLVATANQGDPLTMMAIPNTGQILRVAPDGTTTPIVAALDDPLEIAFTKASRCFVLAGSGVFELKRGRDI
jgi:hypothetical protein